MEQFRYVKTINLADCQPINAVFTDYGLAILQCQTPVTHQLNGNLHFHMLISFSILTFYFFPFLRSTDFGSINRFNYIL